jgi:hypothetical protein
MRKHVALQMTKYRYGLRETYYEARTYAGELPVGGSGIELSTKLSR